MSYRLGVFSDVRLVEAQLSLALHEHDRAALPRLDKLWTYYRNPLQPVGVGRGSAGRWYRLAQEVGLPARIRGDAQSLRDDRAPRAEIVIENDIAWRVQSMIDFMFGKPVRLRSTARDAATRARIERILDRVWELSGGIALLQDMALMGHVFGHVDLLLRIDEDRLIAASQGELDDRDMDTALSALSIEVVEPRRGVPIVNGNDYRQIDAYLIRSQSARTQTLRDSEDSLSLRGMLRALTRSREEHAGQTLEIISAHAWQIYRDGALAWEQQRSWTAGELPLVHVQNISQPLEYTGQSEVEPLIPLQDELNTRLSDRASRVTLQSFQMYLAKGVEGLEQVGPGQVWYTDNMEASVTAFGGDNDSPSEAAHIREVREALDKVSGVPPLSGGVVQGRIGNLSSANALRITLMGLTSKTARKRVTYGRGIAQICRLVLAALHTAGVLETDELDRGVLLDWPDPLPTDIGESTQLAAAQRSLGVSRERVLEELGVEQFDAGVQ
jgi:hypothetical protein